MRYVSPGLDLLLVLVGCCLSQLVFELPVIALVARFQSLKLSLRMTQWKCGIMVISSGCRRSSNVRCLSNQ